MKVKLRTATLEDCRLLAEIHCQSWQAAYRGILPETLLQKITPRDFESKFCAAVVSVSETIMLALLDGQICGYMLYGPCRDEDLAAPTGEIWGIYLLPSCWGKGIGRSLLEYGLAALKRCRYRKAVLWVMQGNHKAIGFYEKMGFTADGAVKTLPLGKDIQALRYVKELV